MSSPKTSTWVGSGTQSHYTRQSIPALPADLLTLKNARFMKSTRQNKSRQTQGKYDSSPRMSTHTSAYSQRNFNATTKAP
jgi:hypothetical protein